MTKTFTITDKFGSLLLRFLIMTFAVIILMLLSQFSIDYSLKDVKSDARLILAISNQQKMVLQVSQQITNDQLEATEMDLSLDSLLNKVMRNQNQTLGKGIKARESFIGQYKEVNIACQGFYAATETAINSDNLKGYVNLLNKQQSYLEALEKLTVVINDYSNTKINRFERMQQFVMIGTVMCIALGAVFIFLPAMRRIKQQNESLRKIAYNQSHIVRRPLANIKLFLHLMYLSTEQEKEEMLEMIRLEADQLDNIICRSVKQAEYYSASQSRAV